MHRLGQKVSDAFHNQPHSHSTPLHSNSDLTSTWERDQYRYRKHRGVNLGSWFVLERWISPSPFRCAQAPAQSDLDVARGAQAKEILESHWDTWMTEEDWGWIAERGINAVRIPIGYYHLCGLDPSVIHGTDFEGLGHVYGGAWWRICDAIATARRFGIGVLIDLHAAPGKQNPDSHSGTSNPPTFFTDGSNKSHTIEILRILVHALSPSPSTSISQGASSASQSPSTSAYPNIIGIELLNEPHPPNANDDVLKQWYTAAINALRRVNASIPIIIGDCWRMEGYAEYIKSLSSSSEAMKMKESVKEAMKEEEEEEEGMIILDHHLYRCFTSSDISTSASAHSQSLVDRNACTPQTFARVSAKLGGACVGGGMVVGEWSGALNPGSLTQSGNGGCVGVEGQVREWIEAQMRLFERCCAGWFFWTYKKEGRGGGNGKDVDVGWCLRDAVDGGVFPDWVGLRLRATEFNTNNFDSDGDGARRDKAREACKEKALGAHKSYWSRYPGTYHHQRFRDGFGMGWDDAWRFFGSGIHGEGTHGAVMELGFKGAWLRRRTRTQDRKEGTGFWEFEHGFNQGVDAARGDFERVYCQCG